MNKIRGRAGLVVLIIGLSLAAFILTDLLRSLSAFGGPSNVVAEVGGKEISIQDYEKRVNALVQIQANMTGQAPDEQAMQQLRDQVWRSMLNEMLYGEEYDRYGLRVSEDELAEMLTGTFIHPFIKSLVNQPGQPQQSDAQIRQIVQQSLKETDKNPQLMAQWQMIETQLIEQRQEEKYKKLLGAGIFVSKGEAMARYNEDNSRATFTFLAINYGSIPDNSVQVTDDDYRAYYDEHREEFRVQQPEVVLKYVLFPLRATKADSTKLLADMNDLRERFKQNKNAAEDSAFAVANSDADTPPMTFGFQNPDELDFRLAAFAKGLSPASKDTVIGPYEDGGFLKLAKLTDYNVSDKPSYRIRHLLIAFKGNTAKDTADALGMAQDLLPQLKQNKDQFPNLVAQFSDDQQSKFMSGEVGYVKPGQFGAEFDKNLAALNPQVGQVYGPIKGAKGYHIVEITGKNNTLVRFAVLTKAIRPSTETEKAVYALAGQLQTEGSDVKSFEKAATAKKYTISTTEPITTARPAISGIAESKELVAWALDEERSVGDLSDIVQTEAGYVVAILANKSDVGYRPLEAIKDQFKLKVFNAKKAQLIVSKLGGLKADSLAQMSTLYGAGAYVAVAREVAFSAPMVQGIGDEPKVIGSVFALKPGQMSKPIVGKGGVFMVQLQSVTPAPPVDDAQLANYIKSLEMNKRNTFAAKVQQAKMQDADVKDYRFKFYR